MVLAVLGRNAGNVRGIYHNAKDGHGLHGAPEQSDFPAYELFRYGGCRTGELICVRGFQ